LALQPNFLFLNEPAAGMNSGEIQELLLMDEPTMGSAPIMVQTIVNVIRSLKKEGRTILLVEQMAMIALHISDRAYIMWTGKILLEGEGKALLKDPNVKKAYLGE
jgi:branched-chain amino acid transport system ATP-binding protein